ncbi:hypothetical protein QFZ32_008344 [Streptomyces canus]|nr:hypothetical protein [Streptomyces canus]
MNVCERAGRSPLPLSGADQAGLVGDDDELGAVAGAEFGMARLTAVLTVTGVTKRRSALSSWGRPVDTKDTALRSRGVSVAGRPGAARSSAGGWAVMRAMRLLVAVGAAGFRPTR